MNIEIFAGTAGNDTMLPIVLTVVLGFAALAGLVVMIRQLRAGVREREREAEAKPELSDEEQKQRGAAVARQVLTKSPVILEITMAAIAVSVIVFFPFAYLQNWAWYAVIILLIITDCVYIDRFLSLIVCDRRFRTPVILLLFSVVILVSAIISRMPFVSGQWSGWLLIFMITIFVLNVYAVRTYWSAMAHFTEGYSGDLSSAWKKLCRKLSVLLALYVLMVAAIAVATGYGTTSKWNKQIDVEMEDWEDEDETERAKHEHRARFYAAMIGIAEGITEMWLVSIALTVPLLAFILVLILGERKLIRQMLAELETYGSGEIVVNHIDTEAPS